MQEELNTGISKAVDAALAFFEEPNALEDQAAYIRKLRARSGAGKLGCAIPLIALAAFLAPPLFTWARTLPLGGRGPVTIFAIGLVIGSLAFIFGALRDLARSRTISIASSLQEACEIFYQKALCASGESMSLRGRDDHLRDAAWVFPKPILESSLKKLHTLADAWEKLRIDFCSKDTSLKLMHLDIKSTLIGSGVYDIEVKVVTEGSKKPAVFLNTAINVRGSWFLLNMTPQLKEEKAQSVQAED